MAQERPIQDIPAVPAASALSSRWARDQEQWQRQRPRHSYIDTFNQSNVSHAPAKQKLTKKRKSMPASSFDQLQSRPTSSITAPQLSFQDSGFSGPLLPDYQHYYYDDHSSSQATQSSAFAERPKTNRIVPDLREPAHGTADGSSTSPSAQPQIMREHDRPDAPNVEITQSEGLHYHAFDEEYKTHASRFSQAAIDSRPPSNSAGDRPVSQHLDLPQSRGHSRPNSTSSDPRDRALASLSAHSSDRGSPRPYSRDGPEHRRSPSSRVMSYVGELNNVPYSQQIAPGGAQGRQSLQNIVGSGASLLDTKKTIDMYRANIKKDTDLAVQYEFAVLMVNTAQNATPGSGLDPAELISEAKIIFQRLADRAYPFAQYYLGDGYSSGLFNNGTPDDEKAFQHFVAAAKHGHAEAGYRTALCYEFGSGTNKSYPKAHQFFRASASKNHPGAATRLGLACIHGDMGFGRDKYREGVKWLKRAQESADAQYNSAPFELGVLHLTGFGDDIFKDEAYAAQLFTQSAELGHPQANFLMGEAYENGLYGCPKDVALSVHFYNGAATKGHPDAMMALCAWYLVGAEPVLEKDEAEAFAWASQAAKRGLLKAQYTVGYFTEMGIGCRRDPLEANVWYVRAAERGDPNAKQRLQVIRAAAAGNSSGSKHDSKVKEKKKFMGLFCKLLCHRA